MNNDALLSYLHQCESGLTIALDRDDILDAFLDYKDAPQIIKDLSQLSDHSPIVTEKRAMEEFEKWGKAFGLEYYYDIRTNMYILRTKK